MPTLEEIKKKKMLENARLYDENMAMLGLAPTPVTKEPAKTDKPVAPKKVVKQPTKQMAKKPSESEELISKLKAAPETTELEEDDFFIPEESAPIEEPIEREPASKGYDLGGFEDVVATGAGPLLAFLGGASPAVFNMHMKKANDAAKIIGDEAKVTKDKIAVVEDKNGNPENILVKDSLGRKPYYQKKATGVQQTRQFQPVTLKNVNTGEIRGAKVNANGYFDQNDIPYDMNEWLPFKTDDLIRERTMQGGSKVTARDKYTGKLKGVSAQMGLGDRFGGVSKEEATSGINQTEKGRQAALEPLEAFENARFAYESLGAREMTPQKAAAAMTVLAKAINKDKVSDADFVHLKGEAFKSYITQFEEWAQGKIGGQVPPQAIQAFRQIAREIMIMKQQEAQLRKRTLVPSNLLPSQGQGIIDNMTGVQNVQQNNDWKNKLKGMR